jgi:hypothetical protein
MVSGSFIDRLNVNNLSTCGWDISIHCVETKVLRVTVQCMSDQDEATHDCDMDSELHFTYSFNTVPYIGMAMFLMQGSQYVS